jgi:uncharacterized membrane protein
LALNLWKNFSSRIRRILTILAFFLLSLIITIAGVFTSLSREEANDINSELEKIRQNINTQLIFGNNFMISLIMFVPIIGPIFGFYALYNTGVAIAAQSIGEGIHPLTVFLFLFIFPPTWLEFIAYSTAIAESFWLAWRIIKHKGKKEIVNACILISICAVMLLIAAIIEIALITYLM